MSNYNRYGLLIDLDFCTGCHTCEVACKQALDLPTGQFGIKVHQEGPRKLENGKWEYTFVPFPTSLCNLCEDRVKVGKLPSCVHHCSPGIMHYGTIEELTAKANAKPHMVLFAPQ
ncbi:oxidoreductase [Dehalobacter sp. DCM]|uniref:oxidoreductase n=1 Tax=Dehalobacter sp. DCM TaxID=2907827 RepID=UPI0030818770|nr:oxidoreductase [Dehalobacter sp. DCM]